MTVDPFTELVDAVIAVADFPPAKGGTNVYAAKVPWHRIQRLRAALDAAGIEWRS